MQIKSVRDYIASTIKTPFFLFVSDKQYLFIKDELKVCGLDFVPISRFCYDCDKIPDIDGLFSYIESADINAVGKRFVITGLGEFLALCGYDEALRTLLRLKELNIGGAKVVLLLRGLSTIIGRLENDPCFDDRRHSVVDNAECTLSFTLTSQHVGLSVLNGYKDMLLELENGRNGNIVVNTLVDLNNAIFTVHQISNAYDGIKFFTSGFTLDRSCGNDVRWMELLKDLNKFNGSLDEVFDEHGLCGNLESDFYVRIVGNDYLNWLYFICLKKKADTIQNGYLRYVLDKTNRFEDFLANVLNSIIEISHNDKQFAVMNQERKILVDKFPESDIANFVINNRQNVSESIYRLTDNTRVEREEIIAWLSNNGLITQLEDIYPILAAYLKTYVFKCSDLRDLLNDYFVAYKRQKLLNRLEPEFLSKVDDLALSRQFNRLQTRDEIMDSIDKTETFLYWLDALGVEYLGLIESIVQKKGLSINVNIARAELPTITSINRSFYDSWTGHKEKSDELDDIKHKDSGGYNFTNNKLPIHLAKELDIIVDMIDYAATKLALRQYKRILIVSDHGASRLAVLHNKEEKYETDTTGEHSGRCCKTFLPYDLPFAAEENGYIVLADYGRFKGSRAANVEVHGGATLEEVIVPIIELSLKDSRVSVKLVNDIVTVDFRQGTEIELFFNSVVKDVSLILSGKHYQGVQLDDNHFKVALPDIKRSCDYPADVYAGDDLIGKIIIKVQGKSGKVNDAFDNLF